MSFYPYMLLLLQAFILYQVNSATSVLPTWLPNNYFQTMSWQIKKGVTTTFGSANPITATVNFTKTYTVIPQLAYGIKNYRGSDRLTSQNFALTLTGISLTDFQIYTMITGTTNIRILTIIYLAVDRSFPYHLNIFNDIQVNFTLGASGSNPLTNISGTRLGDRQFTNTINYTELAGTINSNYTLFGSDLAKNQVALYLCAIYNAGEPWASATKLLKFDVLTVVLNTEQFQINVKIYDGYQIDLIRFSIVITDVADVQSSGLFTIQYDCIVMNAQIVNYISIPRQFAPATFIGLLDYSAETSGSGLQFNWQLDLANDRIIIQPSITYTPTTVEGLLAYRVVIFYVKTWNCPYPNIYFNLVTDMCDDFCAKYNFANSTAAECQPCLFSCYSCVNGPAMGCTSCNAAEDHRVIANDSCTCMDGFHEDPSGVSKVCLACSSSIADCQTCQLDGSSNVVCLSCNNGFALINSSCVACPVPNCGSVTLINGSCFCSQCLLYSGYVADGLGACAPCSNYIPNCDQCPNQLECSVCNASANYFTNITNLCQLCDLDNCLLCTSLLQCTTCNQTNDYFRNAATQVCQQCSLNQCLDCLSESQCLQCNQTADFFLNLTLQICQPCALTGCLDCQSMTECTTCNQYLDFFIITPSNTCSLCTLNQCIDCFSLNTCVTCNQTNDFFLNLTSSQCQTCFITGCIDCRNISTCQVCDTSNNYALISDGTCAQCPFTCLCDGYVLPQVIDPVTSTYVCGTQCGDGLVRGTQICDDGNLIDGDGCSSQCQVEQAWRCDSNPNYTCCSLQNAQIQLYINKIIKIPNKNSLTLQLQIKPSLSILTTAKIQESVSLTVIDIPLYNERKKATTDQKLQVTYNYNQSIHGKKGSIILSLSFSQAGAPSCIISATKTISIIAQANNNLPFMFYDEQELKKYEQVQKSVNALQIITYIIFFMSMIPAKIVGLELIGVLQLAYFSLAQQENVNILLEPFMSMNSINGLNYNLTPENSEKLPDQVSALGIQALFLNNCNVMLLLIACEISVAAILYGLGHILKSFSQKLSSVSKYLIKQGLVTLMMFNVFNIAFGVGIHFQYADKSNQGYTLSTLAAFGSIGILLVISFLLMFTQSKQFGEFKNKLKPDLMSQLYFVFSLAYRFVLGYYIAVRAEYTLSSLIIVGFSLIFIGYNLINLPFKQAYQNYRANVCHFAQLIILVVTNYYDSMTENDSLQKRSYEFTGAEVQIGAIYGSVGISICCLAVQIFKFIKQKIISSRKKPLISNSYQRKSIQNLQSHEDLNAINFKDVKVKQNIKFNDSIDNFFKQN